MGPVPGPGSQGSLLPTSLPILFEVPIGLFETRLLGIILPPLLPSLRLEAVVERSYSVCYKYLFLPLLGSLLSFLSYLRPTLLISCYSCARATVSMVAAHSTSGLVVF